MEFPGQNRTSIRFILYHSALPVSTDFSNPSGSNDQIRIRFQEKNFLANFNNDIKEKRLELSCKDI